MSDSKPPVDASPGWLRLAMEARAPLEYAASLAAWPILSSAPRGDGHTVIVYPPFLGNDLGSQPLRLLLRQLGHDAQGWGQGVNLGPRPAVLDEALAHLQALYRQSGAKLSLVGWSLGGVFARELAKRAPGAVRGVVTLGSPFAQSPHSAGLRKLFTALSGKPSDDAARYAALRVPPPVPTTSIYSRSDAIVGWPCSVAEPGPQVENIEVEASHAGLGLNPMALYALADRLAQPEGAWQPFERTGLRRLFYREPAPAGPPAAAPHSLPPRQVRAAGRPR